MSLIDGSLRSATAIADGALPPHAFTLTEGTMSRLLCRLFSAAGAAWVAKAGHARVVFEAAVEQLSIDVSHLLLRFGIRSRRRERWSAHATGRRRTFEVEVVEAPSLLRFCERIGIAGKDTQITAVADAVWTASIEFVEDGLPMQAWDDVLKAKGERSWADVNRLVGRASGHDWNVHRRRPRRETVALLAELLGSDVLRRWSSPDIAWDPIVSIEPCGTDQVYDFNVPGTHNFVAADVFVHNTAFGLGMAVHAAQTARVPVLVFSLEMGHAELTQRILSSEARVDSSKLRNGRLTEADWTKLGRAVGRLEVPLYLDELPGRPAGA